MPCVTPEICRRDPGDEGQPVTVLRYESGAEPTAFAFSNDSFEFLQNSLDEDGLLEFQDASGAYRVDISTNDDFGKEPGMAVQASIVTKLGCQALN